MSDNNVIISCKNIWKIFGSNAAQIIDDDSKTSISKQELLEKTGHVIAVKDVSFDVRESEIFVVMGLSGSGKSTLIRCINRLIEPTKGEIHIDGADIAHVGFGLEIRGEHGHEKEEKITQALEQVGLSEWKKSRIDELSGGMQQRVGLARALAGGANILLMDEPFSALDPLIRRQMQDEFINLRSEVRQTVVFITHDLMEALRLGDRIAIMKDGEIVQIGSPQQIVANPADEYVSEFVKDVPRGQVIPVRSIMERPAVLVTAEQELEDIVKILLEKEAATGFVINGFRRIIGTISLVDAQAALESGATKGGDALNLEYPSAPPTATLDDCLQIVADTEAPLAVVNDRGHLLGIATTTALIQALRTDGGNGNGNGH